MNILKERYLVGAKVYRVLGLEIQEGQIIKICRGEDQGTPDIYTATFPGDPFTHSQTYERNFFLDLKNAQEKLKSIIQEQISYYEENIRVLRKKMPEILS